MAATSGRPLIAAVISAGFIGLAVPGRAVVLVIEEPWPVAGPVHAIRAVLDPARVKQGGYAVLTVTDTGGRMKGTADVLGLEVNLYPAPGGLRALVPVPLTTKPGRHRVRVTVGNRETRIFMSVARRPVRPVRQIRGLIVSPEKAEALRTDKGKLGRILGRESREALWSAVLRRPVPGPVTAKYGVPRSYGGGAGWVHKGADFAMPRSWPVIAPTGGTVRLARSMGSYGNIIVVDHGQGVFTTYLHLRSFLVNPDDRVEAGQVIGTVGATGMATGPHLHFGVFIHRVAVDPVEFLTRGLP